MVDNRLGKLVEQAGAAGGAVCYGKDFERLWLAEAKAGGKN